MIELDRMPVGWTESSLGTVICPRKGKVAPSTVPGQPFVGLEHVEACTGRLLGHGDTHQVRSAVGRFFAGDVLYGRLRPYLSKVVHLEFDGAASAEFIIFPGESDIIAAEFLCFLLMTEEFIAFTSSLDRGDRPRVKWEQIAQFRFALPPIAEQRRIADRMRVLLSRIGHVRLSLVRAQSLIETLKERLPEAAFSGASLEVSPAGESAQLELPEYEPSVRFSELPQLPERWKWAEMESLAHVGGGVTKNQKRSALPLEKPYLRVANVYTDELRLQEIATIRVSEAEARRTRLVAEDILVVEGNGSIEQIGRVAQWDGSIGDCLHQNHLIRVRAKPKIPPRYLLHWLMSPAGRGALETVASSSSGLHTLSLSKIESLPVPVPPTISIMKKISDHLDDSFRAISLIQAETSRAWSLLDRLRERMWCRAFRGDLVPQDPHDEPASEMLSRVLDPANSHGASA